MENFNISGHGPIDPSDKKIALLISVLALSETLGKSAQIGVGRKEPAPVHLS